MSKPKVGFYWCASCGGCEETIVDLNEAILGVVEAVDIVLWPCAMDFKREDVLEMADGEMAVCFVNGALRTDEQREWAEILRKKSGLLVAFGSCSHMGGIPGLANLTTKDAILANSYGTELPTVTNSDFVLPQASVKVPEGTLTLPTLDEDVKTLDQVVPVDYYLPGCPPPVRLIQGALNAILTGQLPEKGSVLAPDKALCDECPRQETKPEKPSITEFKRPHTSEIDPLKCLLAQGFFCMGPATRAGCDSACISGNMPCTGCLGPTSRVIDQGAKALSAMASLLEDREEEPIRAKMAVLADVPGTFYRYGLPSSLLFRKQVHGGKP